MRLNLARLLLRSILVSFPIWITMFCSFVFWVQRVEARAQAIRLEQKHVFMGKTVLTVSPTGLRMENRDRLKFVLVAHAPQWRVTIFRLDDKTCFSQSLNEFESSGLFSGFVHLLPERNVERAKYKRSVYMFQGEEVIRMTNMFATFKYVPLGEIAPQAESIVHFAYKVPTNGGLPLAYIKAQSGRDYTSGTRESGRLESILDTTKFERIADDPAFYLVPAGLKPAKSLGVVFAGKDIREQSVDFQNLFDISGDLHKKSK